MAIASAILNYSEGFTLKYDVSLRHGNKESFRIFKKKVFSSRAKPVNDMDIISYYIPDNVGMNIVFSDVLYLPVSEYRMGKV